MFRTCPRLISTTALATPLCLQPLPNMPVWLAGLVHPGSGSRNTLRTFTVLLKLVHTTYRPPPPLWVPTSRTELSVGFHYLGDPRLRTPDLPPSILSCANFPPCRGLIKLFPLEPMALTLLLLWTLFWLPAGHFSSLDSEYYWTNISFSPSSSAPIHFCLCGSIIPSSMSILSNPLPTHHWTIPGSAFSAPTLIQNKWGLCGPLPFPRDHYPQERFPLGYYGVF